MMRLVIIGGCKIVAVAMGLLSALARPVVAGCRRHRFVRAVCD